MTAWARQLALRLAVFQVLDAVGNALVPRRYLDKHLDHLGVPTSLRPLLTPIKITTAGGLLVGLQVPRVGAMTAAALVAYYSAAATFHVSAKDHPVVAGPAVACGAAAAIALVRAYNPRRRI